MLVLIASLTCSLPTAPPPVAQERCAVVAGAPSAEVVGISPGVHVESALRGFASIEPGGRGVAMRWRLVRDGETVVCRQAFEAPYRLTALASADGALVVAGVRPSSATVVERWRFDWPALPAAGAEYAPRVAKEVLYDACAVGRNGVRFLNPMLSPRGEDAVLVHWADSHDVERLDLASRELAPVASSATTPALAHREWTGIWAARHPSAGYVYVYASDPNAVSDAPGRDRSLVLLDADYDGRIDDARALTDAEWLDALGGRPGPGWELDDG